MSADDRYLMHRQMTRRAWLLRAGLLAGSGLLAACAPAAPAASTQAPAAAAKPTPPPAAAPTTAPAAAAAPTTAPAAAAKPTTPPAAPAPTAPAAAPTTAPATAGKKGGKLTWALEQDPVHKHKDVLRHTYAVVEGCDASDLTLRLAALFHDVGKPRTREYTPEGVQFHHHEVVGARMAEARLRELRYPSAVIDDVRTLIEMHLRFHGYGDGWTDAAVRRYVRDAGPLLDRLNQLTRADVTTANLFKAKQFRALQDDLEERIARLAEEENLDAMSLAVRIWSVRASRDFHRQVQPRALLL